MSITGSVLIKHTQNGVIFTYAALNPNLDGAIWLETNDLHFGDPNRDKFLEHIKLIIAQPVPFVNFTVEVAHKQRQEEETVWGTPTLVTDPAKPIWVRKTNRYFRVRIKDNYVRGNWKLTNIQFFGRPMGGREA